MSGHKGWKYRIFAEYRWSDFSEMSYGSFGEKFSMNGNWSKLKEILKKKKADKTSNDTHIEVVSFKKTMYV